MSRYLSENTKTGDFNQQRTLSGSFLVIPERLALIRAVVLAFTANKQTNKQLYIVKLYIYIISVIIWMIVNLTIHGNIMCILCNNISHCNLLREH